MSEVQENGIRYGCMVLGPVATNSYFFYRTGTDEDKNPRGIPVLLFDPPAEGERIYQALSERGFTVEMILLTHAHFDHIDGVEGLQRAASEDGSQKIPVAALKEERPLCEDPKLNCSLSMGGRGVVVSPDRWLSDHEIIEAAGLVVEVLATPGHTIGGCCYYIKEAGAAVCGDTLFCGSVGRTDLPTGNMSVLLESIRTRLFTLPESTLLLPGHGEETTVGEEIRENPFVGRNGAY